MVTPSYKTSYKTRVRYIFLSTLKILEIVNFIFKEHKHTCYNKCLFSFSLSFFFIGTCGVLAATFLYSVPEKHGAHSTVVKPV